MTAEPVYKINADVELRYGIAITIVGFVIYFFSHILQMNVYNEPNFMLPLSKALHDQTSLTTFGICLTYAGMMIALSFAASRLINKELFHLRTLGSLVIGIRYSIYEIQQILNPVYIDNHIMDLILCWLAILIVYVGWVIVHHRRNNKQSP